MKHHERKNALFSTFFKITSLDIIFKKFSKPRHNVSLVTSENNISRSHSEKNFQKLDVCVKHHESENALFLTIF